MQYNIKTRRYGEYTIPNNLFNGVDEKSIEALDELIKAGTAGILSIALRDNIELGGPAAPYIKHLRDAGFRIHTEAKALHHYRGTMRVCGRYTLLSIPHVSMLPAVELDNQPDAVATSVAVASVSGIQLALDLFPNAANEHSSPDQTGGVAI